MKAMRISTGSASKVWQDFIESGGQGSNNGWLPRGDKVLVAETRRCRQRGGGVPEDLRVLQPIEAFGDFGEDGRLKSFPSFLVCNTDTPLQKKVKRARLTRIEVVAVVLYTGTLSVLCLHLRSRGLISAIPCFSLHVRRMQSRNFLERHSSLHFVLNVSSFSPMMHA
jgi:hypothetical protein